MWKNFSEVQSGWWHYIVIDLVPMAQWWPLHRPEWQSLWGTVVTSGAQITVWSSSDRPATEWEWLRFTDHLSPPCRAASTEAFIITITFMVLKAHVRLLLSVCLEERKSKLRVFSQQMLLDQMARNYYLDHWREVRSKIWLSPMGPHHQGCW